MGGGLAMQHFWGCGRQDESSWLTCPSPWPSPRGRGEGMTESAAALLVTGPLFRLGERESLPLVPSPRFDGEKVPGRADEGRRSGWPSAPLIRRCAPPSPGRGEEGAGGVRGWHPPLPAKPTSPPQGGRLGPRFVVVTPPRRCAPPPPSRGGCYGEGVTGRGGRSCPWFSSGA